METTEKTLKTHEINEITEKRVGWEVKEGKWYEIRDEWGCTLVKDKQYAEHGLVRIVSGDPKCNYDYTFDTYESAFEFAYEYEQSKEYLNLQEQQKNSKKYEQSQPYF